MFIYYSDIREDILVYKVVGDIVYANFRGKVYKVDFASLEDGVMIDSDSGFISKACKKDGILNVTLRRPVDANGNEIAQEDFIVDGYEEVEIQWKTQEEIDKEKNKLQPPTTEERLKMAENAILGLMNIIIGGM